MNALLDRLYAEPAATHHRGHLVIDRLCETPEFGAARAVMVFLSMKREIDTTPLALRAWNDGKRVLAPHVAWSEGRMTPIEISSLSSDVREEPRGFRQPIVGPPYPLGEIDLVVVPGLAFDERGERLGRGKGFYDRFLAHADLRATFCGLALEEQVVAELPIDPHDRAVDMLVTDQRVRRFQARGRAAEPAP